LQTLSSKQVFGLVLWQLAVTLILSAILLAVFSESGWTIAYSALTGGLIATLANGWFALKVFNPKRKDDAVVMLRSFYWGEINKLIFTGAMFIAAFVLIRPVNGAALIAVYFFVHMTPFVVNMFMKDTI
jgi:ATP synthase protein I